MAKRKALLIEGTPKHYEEGGLFYVDLGVDDLPLLVFRPHTMLKAIGRARGAYAAWASDDGAEVLERG